MMRWPQVRCSDDGSRVDRARAWEQTARVTLAVAVGIGVLAAVSSPHWDVGDLLIAVYFAAMSLMLWGQGARIRCVRSRAPFTTTVAGALAVAFALGLVLAVVDVATGGSL